MLSGHFSLTLFPRGVGRSWEQKCSSTKGMAMLGAGQGKERGEEGLSWRMVSGEPVACMRKPVSSELTRHGGLVMCPALFFRRVALGYFQ